jgi:hypothetical protein
MAKSLGDQIRAAVRNSGQSRYRICNATGISQANLSRFVRGLAGIELESLNRLTSGRSKPESKRSIRQSSETLASTTKPPPGSVDSTECSMESWPTLAWCQGIPERMTGTKLGRQSALGPFIDGYIADRSDLKGSTAKVYGHTRRNLIAFLGADKPLASVTKGDADEFRRFLARPEAKKGQELADNTVRRRCAIAKQYFQAAVDRGLIALNPFGKMKGLAVRGNESREFFVTRETAQRVLDTCPDSNWRLLFALSRYGGLRCPSEHFGLRFGAI